MSRREYMSLLTHRLTNLINEIEDKLLIVLVLNEIQQRKREINRDRIPLCCRLLLSNSNDESSSVMTHPKRTTSKKSDMVEREKTAT